MILTVQWPTYESSEIERGRGIHESYPFSAYWTERTNQSLYTEKNCQSLLTSKSVPASLNLCIFWYVRLKKNCAVDFRSPAQWVGGQRSSVGYNHRWGRTHWNNWWFQQTRHAWLSHFKSQGMKPAAPTIKYYLQQGKHCNHTWKQADIFTPLHSWFFFLFHQVGAGVSTHGTRTWSSKFRLCIISCGHCRPIVYAPLCSDSQ